MIFETWTSFELAMTAFVIFDSVMLMYAYLHLKKISRFNRDLHAVLLERQQEERLKSHIHMAIQSPIKIWREQEQPKKLVEAVLIEEPKKKPKKPDSPEQEKPTDVTPAIPVKKIVPKTMQECEPLKHKWVLDKEKQYYCEVCGKRF